MAIGDAFFAALPAENRNETKREIPSQQGISGNFPEESEASNANLWNDEIRMPFDQIPQADFRCEMKIVGTKVESLREQEAHTAQKEFAATMVYVKSDKPKFFTSLPHFVYSPEERRVERFTVVERGVR